MIKAAIGLGLGLPRGVGASEHLDFCIGARAPTFQREEYFEGV
jgi:hypothetical protein